MAFWKQLVLCLVLLAGAFVLWVRYDPSAVARLKGYGIDEPFIAAIASPEPKDEKTAGNGQSVSDAGQGERGKTRTSLVVTSKVGTATLNNRVKAIGSGVAVRTATITPTDTGTLRTVKVKAGDHVKPGQTIATLDSESQEIAAENAKLTLADAQKKLKRYKELRQSAAVTSVQISDQESMVAADRLAVKKAEYNLSKRTIAAPIAGVVGIVNGNIGDFVTSQTTIGTIDDRSTILVDFQVPERFSGAIRIGGEVDAKASAYPGRVFKGDVSAIDNRVDPDSRTLRVRAEIPNGEDLLRAGMSFLVTMHFPGDRYAAVDPLAVQWDSTGAYVWKVVDRKAERVSISLVQRNPQNILVDGKLGSGDAVVTQGVQVLRSGAQVRIANSEDQAPSSRPSTTSSPKADTVKSRGGDDDTAVRQAKVKDAAAL